MEGREEGNMLPRGFFRHFLSSSLALSLAHTNRVMSSPPAGRDIATALGGRTDEPTEHGKADGRLRRRVVGVPVSRSLVPS